jgi:hypothetical protein
MSQVDKSNGLHAFIMKVVIFFVGNSDLLRNALFGRYIGGGFLFVEGSKIEAFHSRAGEEYSKHIFSDATIEVFKKEGLETEFLLLSVDEEETRKIRATCEACAATHKQFNLQDVLLMLIPFRDPPEISIVDAKKLNNTQTIILVLRECLNSDNPLRLGLEGLNSRMTFLDNLYDRLAPYALPVLWCNLAPPCLNSASAATEGNAPPALRGASGRW